MATLTYQADDISRSLDLSALQSLHDLGSRGVDLSTTGLNSLHRASNGIISSTASNPEYISTSKAKNLYNKGFNEYYPINNSNALSTVIGGSAVSDKSYFDGADSFRNETDPLYSQDFRDPRSRVSCIYQT